MKTIAWIPAGRAQYLKILIPYLLRDKGILDRVYFCVNTENEGDIAYIHSMCKKYSDYFECIYLDPGIKPNGSKTVRSFYKNFTEKNTIYLKIDDDICFLQKGLLQDLIKFRKQNKQYFLVFANLVNTTLCSHIHQHLGALNYKKGIYEWDPFCKLGWERGEGAENVHECFLAAIKNGKINKFLFPRWEIPYFDRTSINLICYFGEDSQIFSPLVQNAEDDELFLSRTMPRQLLRINAICGKKIGAHFAYYTQRDYLEQTTTLLEQYYRVSKTLFEI